MKKFLIITVGLLAAVTAAALAVFYRWMQTPNGRLHPVMALAHQWMLRSRAPFTLENLPESRQEMKNIRPRLPIYDVQNLTIAGPGGEIPLRIYKGQENGRLPVIVFFHGGGFVLGSIQSHENVVRQMAVETGALVISVDYRLAPEHPFPAGLDDCYAAVQWAEAHAAGYGGDPAQLAVAGDSAGGNLAAAVCLRARAEGGPAIGMQALLYPATIMRDDDSESSRQFVGYVLYEEDLLHFHDWYMGETGQEENPYASPLLAKDLSQLPPAYVLTAGMDPLRDQGKAYADRLRAAGVPVVYRNYEGMLHGFLNMVDFPLPGGRQMLSTPQLVYQEMAAFMAETLPHQGSVPKIKD